MLTIISAFAEFERDRISERIRDAKRQMRTEGRRQGGKRPFGFSVDGAGLLHPEVREQAALIEMRQLRDAGKSYRAIAEALAGHGIEVDYTTVRRNSAAGKQRSAYASTVVSNTIRLAKSTAGFPRALLRRLTFTRTSCG
jgi:DNA invertase Pin-like site-specific DNA recombinase